MAMIRSAGLRGFRHVVTELGGDPVALARRVRLDPLALDTDELLVDDVAVATVLELAAARLHRPDLGLLVSRHQDIGLLGPLAVAIVNAPTVGDTLDATSRYMFVHAPSLSVRLAPDPYGVRGVSALVYEVAPGPLPAPRQVIDICLGFLDGLLRSVVGGPYGLRTVELSHEPLAPIGVYEEFFGVRVLTGRPAALLRIPTSLVSRPLEGADPGIRRMALDFLERQTPPDDGLAPRVADALRQTLGTSAPELGDIASLLAVHPRTLQRTLARENTGFAQLLDSVRRERAHHYLTTTDLPLGQVAALLGLSEQSALSRSARRWWVTAPRDRRRAAATPRRT